MEETMKDYEEMLEKSYSLMGDGVHDTDSLLAWKKAEELKTTKAQEMELMDEMIEDVPGSINDPESNGDSDDYSDH